MKRNVSKLLAAALSICTAGVSAQGVWESPVVPGINLNEATSGATYFMYNIGSDAFATNGMNLCQQAIVSKLCDGDSQWTAPQVCNIDKTEDSENTIKITVYGNRYLGTKTEYDGKCWVNIADGSGSNQYAYTQTAEGCYTLSEKDNSHRILDVAWPEGGPMVYEDGQGFTDWAFIPEASITDGSFARYKARKNMYDIYRTLSEGPLTDTQKEALETANETYTQTDATADDVNAATATLLKAVAKTLPEGSMVDASALFTHADMRAVRSNADWTQGGNIGWGDFEHFRSSTVLKQSQEDLPDGLYTVVFHGFFADDTANPPTLTLTSGNRTASAHVPDMRSIDFGVTQGGAADWTSDNGTKPNGMRSAAEALTHPGTVAKVENFLVENGTLTIKVEVTSGGQWFNYQGFDIYYQPASRKESITLTTPSGWGTLMLPFTADIPEGLTVYACGGTTADSNEAVLNLEEVTGGIQANTPYIVSASADFIHTFEGESTAGATTYTAGLLTGTFIEIEAIENSYVLQNQDGNVGFYKVTADAKPKVGAYRAYLNAGSAGSNVQAFVLRDIDGDSTTAGINSTIAEENTLVNVYNLSGIPVRRRVKANEALNGLQKGIYIVNGTKKTVK